MMIVWEAKAGMEVVPVFITVDPERDNVEQVCECVKEFHPDLIGLTGTADETRPVAHAFRVYYMKTEQEGVMLHFCRRQAKVRIQRMRFTANVGSQGDQPPLYIEELFPRREDTGMDRVTGCLMNPNMELVKFFGKNYDADALAEGVVKEIKACT